VKFAQDQMVWKTKPGKDQQKWRLESIKVLTSQMSDMNASIFV